MSRAPPVVTKNASPHDVEAPQGLIPWRMHTDFENSAYASTTKRSNPDLKTIEAIMNWIHSTALAGARAKVLRHFQTHPHSRLYIGVTNDVPERMAEHARDGKGYRHYTILADGLGASAAMFVEGSLIDEFFSRLSNVRRGSNDLQPNLTYTVYMLHS